MDFTIVDHCTAKLGIIGHLSPISDNICSLLTQNVTIHVFITSRLTKLSQLFETLYRSEELERKELMRKQLVLIMPILLTTRPNDRHVCNSRSKFRKRTEHEHPRD